MIYITVKFTIRPEKADQFMDEAAGYTAATRAEEGNIFFEWSRSLDEPGTFVLLEAFRDAAAGSAHVAGQRAGFGIGSVEATFSTTTESSLCRVWKSVRSACSRLMMP